ncbi:MAG: NUDIX domain-containing protein [Hyphomicrobiaceae bacterium]
MIGGPGLFRWLLRRRVVTLGVQGAVVDGEGRFLLVRHGYRPGWHFPGGGVEIGEPVAAALRRELVEEVGVILDGPPKLFAIYSHFVAYPGDHIAVFIVESWQRPHVPAASYEIAEQGFFSPADLPPEATDGTRRRIGEIVGARRPDRAW